MKRLCFVFFLVSAVPALAQDGGQDSPLSGSQGVRALGLGGAVSAWLDEPAALWWNPATLLHTPVRRLELQHTQNAFDTRTEQFALAMPSLDRGAWALAGALQTTSDITITGPTSPIPLGTEDFNRFQLGAGYGVGLPKHIDLGFTLTVSGYRFMGQQRVAWGLDLGIAPFTYGPLRTGLVLRNLLRPTFSFSDGVEDRWARRVVLGLAARPRWGTGALELEVSDRMDPRLRAGGEYVVADRLALRAGYDGEAPTAGFGFRHKQFRIDYAFVKPSELGSEHRIGLSIDIGRPIAEQRRLREERVSYEVAQALEARRAARQPELLTQAESALERGAWAEAASAYAQLSLLFPDNERYTRGQADVARRSDSSLRAQIATATRRATDHERGAILDSLARAQFARRDWTAATSTARRLRQEPGHERSADSIGRLAADSLGSEVTRAVEQASRALSDSAVIEAAGWARLALYHDSAHAEASRLLAEAERQGQRQNAERKLLSAAARDDTSLVLALARDLLAAHPEDALAGEYLRRFTALAKPVSIETLQQDAEAWGWYTQALVAFREGRYEEAKVAWERVLTRYPGSEDTRKNLEQARLRLGAGKD